MEEPGNLLSRIIIGANIFDPLEATLRGGRKAFEERHLVEQHRKVGGKSWHAFVPQLRGLCAQAKLLGKS